MSSETAQEHAQALVHGLSKLQGHKEPPAEQAVIIKQVTNALETASTLESTLLKGVVAAQKTGLHFLCGFNFS